MFSSQRSSGIWANWVTNLARLIWDFFLEYLATCKRDSTDWNYQKLGCYNPSPKLIDILIHDQYYGSRIFKHDLPMESDGSFFQCNIIEELWIEYILDQTLDPHQLLVPLHSYMYTQLYLSLSPSQSIHPYIYIQYIIFDSHLLAIFPLYSCCWWTPIPPHILSYTPYTYEYNQYVYIYIISIYIYMSNSYIYIHNIRNELYPQLYIWNIPTYRMNYGLHMDYHRSKMGTVYIPGHCVTEALQSLSLPEECRLAWRWSRLSISNTNGNIYPINGIYPPANQ